VSPAPPARPFARAVVDAVVLVGVLALVLYPLLDVYGGTVALPAIAGGLLLGSGLALVAAWRRWSALGVVASAVAVYVLAGGALAAPTTTLAGVVPSAQTFVALARGAVTSWAQVVTLQPPLGRSGTVLVAALLLAFVGSLGAVATATRLRGAAASAAAVIPVAVLVVVILLGTANPTVPPLVTGLVTVVVLLGWAAWRAGTLRARRFVAAGALVAVALGAGAAGAPAVVADEPRFVLRDVLTPPFDPRDYASPLSAYRKYLKQLDEKTLFTVSGLPQGARVRPATLDHFDGVVWNVAAGGAESSGEFRRVGGENPVSVPGAPAHVEFTIDALTGVWLPTVGLASGFDLGSRASQLRYNDATGAAVMTGGLSAGMRYELDVVVPRVPEDAEVGTAEPADLQQPSMQAVPDVVGTTAADVARDAGQAVEVARALSQFLIDDGFYSDGEGDQLSLSGHGSDRIATLLGDQMMIGNGEQYASALALMAREMGLPARVVLGFVPAEEDVASDEPVAVTGDDVEAWVEIAFQGHGWVPFDATPPREQTPDNKDQETEPEDEPQVVQPPPPPPDSVTPPDVDTEQPAPEPGDEEAGSSALWRTVAVVAASVLLPLLVLASPFLVIAAIKARRRRRRRRRGDAVTRVAGGWAEGLDTATDLRHPVPALATRNESARALAAAFAAHAQPTSRRHPDVAGQVTTLARSADRAVFGPGEPAPEHVQTYWAEVDRTVAAMWRAVGWRRRVRARLSIASLRRGGRVRRAHRAGLAPEPAVTPARRAREENR